MGSKLIRAFDPKRCQQSGRKRISESSSVDRDRLN